MAFIHVLTFVLEVVLEEEIEVEDDEVAADATEEFSELGDGVARIAKI